MEWIATPGVVHVPVLVREVIGYLAPLREGLVADCTLGAGGHAAALLEAVPGLRVVGVDRDPQARHLAAERLRPFGDRVRVLEGEFAELGELLRRAGIQKVDGILADVLNPDAPAEALAGSRAGKIGELVLTAGWPSMFRRLLGNAETRVSLRQAARQEAE